MMPNRKDTALASIGWRRDIRRSLLFPFLGVLPFYMQCGLVVFVLITPE
jgi:hypothetical protein